MGKYSRKSRYRFRVSEIKGIRLPALCVFFLFGAVLGHLLARLSGGDSVLASQVQNYALLQADGLACASFISVAILYLHYPVMILLLGCCSFGVVGIPMVLLAEGFTFSFAAASLAASLGLQGAFLALAAFGLRSIFTVISTLMLALWALERISGGEAPQRTGERFPFLCFLLLAVGITLELTVVPRLFSLALAALK